MSEKLDLFEMTIKRGLENLEVPMEQNAWSKFEQAYHGASPSASAAVGGQSGSFIAKFAVAGAFLVGTVLFINQSVDTPELHADGTVHETHETIENKGTNASTSSLEAYASDETNHNDSDNTSASSLSNSEDLIEGTHDEIASSSVSEISSETETSAKNVDLTESEKDHIQRINNRLQKAADESEVAEGEPKKRYTTRYLGKDFNLGALKSFSPNADGKNDSFLPSSLEDGDIFQMTISTENGAVVFRSKNVNDPWKGTDSLGKDLAEGKYAWEVVLQKDKKKDIFKGIVKLER